MNLGPFYDVREDGVATLFWGSLEYDPEWRSRDVLVGLEGEREFRAQTKAEKLAAMPCETAIEFIGGLPGGGKSMYSVKLVIDELMHGYRPVVTNLALKLPRIQEYLDSQGFRVNVAERVYLLKTADEIKNFYLRRTHDLLLDSPRWHTDGGKQVVWDSAMDWTPTQEDSEAAGGVFYVIDECHNYFHPEAFVLPKFTPEHPMFQWASQHRKLKDICYFVTQSVENVHVAIRRLGQQFHYIRNYRKETYRGFRRGDGFMRTTYVKQPKSDSAVPVEEKPFVLDVRGIASCYYTAGGVGIQTKGTGDGGHRKKGLSMKWIWVAMAGAICVLIFFLFVLPRMALHAVVDSNLKQVGIQREQPAAAKPAASRGPDERVSQSKEPRTDLVPVAIAQKPATIVPPPVADERVFVVGVLGSLAAGRYSVILSDGRTYTEEDGAVSFVGRGSVVIDGKRYFRAGSGVGSTPVRQGGLPPAAVSASVPTGSRSGAVNSSVAARASTSSTETAPPSGTPSSWRMDADGVQRLTTRDEIGR